MIKTKSLINICLVVVTGCILLTHAGCAQYSAGKLSPVTLYKKRAQSALNSSKPSWETQQFLRLEFLKKRYNKEPEAVIAELYERTRQSRDRELIVATAELSLLQGRRIYAGNRTAATTMYLKAAALAYDYIFEDLETYSYKTLKPSYGFMELIYNRAVSRLIEIEELDDNPWPDKFHAEHLGTIYDISIDRKSPNLWDVGIFDSLQAANEIEVKGLTNTYLAGGLGAPLVGFVDNPVDNPLFGRYSPKDGVAQPATAVLAFDPPKDTDKGRHRKATLSFYNPLLTDYATIEGKDVPLEADYSTSLGVLLAKIKVKSDWDIAALGATRKDLESAGMYMLEPYRPDQIPVVMVHGLMSYPSTWMQMFNDLRGDPLIRSKYQFWFFLYPTGLPILYSASLLRQELLTMRSQFDPDGTNCCFDQMVLVGHSMGGLLAKLMVQDSENLYWDSFFRRSYDEISLSPESKELLASVLFFETLPFIQRVIFLATPHRGSEIADSLFAKIGSSLITQPDTFDKIRDELIAANASDEAIDLTEKVPDGIMLLSPSSVDMRLMASVQLAPSQKYHSIIGIGNSESGPGSSDSIVTYESSHLDGVVSEKLIPSKHSVHKHPLGVAEVKRILKLHLDDDSI